MLATAGRWLGLGMVTLVNIFNPELVLVGGWASAAGELMLDPAREVLAERLCRQPRLRRVVLAHFGRKRG